ncbi:MAG: hypothetical protein M1832_005864 [Thelocarpon impressellum]|nr:MAG: hypothetical protein M1832_005864 [Thelocarpon impressellum]
MSLSASDALAGPAAPPQPPTRSVSEDEMPASSSIESPAETFPDGFGNRYASSIYTLLVGPSAQPFLAHRAVLAHSPVLARLCPTNPPYTLALPAVSPPHFARVLEYLYTAAISPLLSALPAMAALEHSPRAPRLQQRGWEQTALDLAAIYLLGARFALPGLQALVVTKLAKVEILLPTPGAWDVARAVYGGEQQPVRDDFRAWFVRLARERLSRGWGVEQAAVETLIEEGGALAVDLWRAKSGMEVGAERAKAKL